MTSYLIKQQDGTPDGDVIRENSLEEAKKLLREGEVELYALAGNVEQALEVPTGNGRHAGVLWRWILSPTTLAGDFLK